MKLSKEKRTTNTAKRTVSAFSNALIRLLQKNALEQITITMLCDESTYPRSTFYNYFEDIFDLLDCIMEELSNEISVNDFREIDESIRSITLFERTYDVLSNHYQIIEKIIKKNDYNSSFMQMVRSSMRNTISYIINNSECIAQFHVPKEIMQVHYSNTIELVLEHCFLSKEPISKDEAIKTLDFLLRTLEREVKKSDKTD
ncbi:TetR/AcrR family transcriptional regulator [Anaeromicropila herbilytica]|uniref:HTH tetR-type domain-containing protein n=1 Tax=Anaeromicropila herbilytica TaxID=2785025 RepID=A0A7R7EM01_9FIRM|nr:TetR/AcrR family transcriptional regulator [Anaeromicropila herbilytica]BCN30962.1 hypothetical protein bsdtb5_22570 [Anaeromicropila herbilytica]